MCFAHPVISISPNEMFTGVSKGRLYKGSHQSKSFKSMNLEQPSNTCPSLKNEYNHSQQLEKNKIDLFVPV